MISPEHDLDSLKRSAGAASKNAHAPYSRFRVGAAVVDGKGRVFTGCNVENASFGLTMCAERNALAAAVAAGCVAGEFPLILIYTAGKKPAAPCGACRQVIQELLHSDAVIISCCDSEEQMEWTVDEVLPQPFRMEDM